MTNVKILIVDRQFGRMREVLRNSNVGESKGGYGGYDTPPPHIFQRYKKDIMKQGKQRRK